METMREEFEKWWRANEIVPFLEKDESGEYIFSSVRLAFRAWKSSARIEREACAKVAEDQTHLSRVSLSSILGDEAICSCHVAAAIRARGGE